MVSAEIEEEQMVDGLLEEGGQQSPAVVAEPPQPRKFQLTAPINGFPPGGYRVDVVTASGENVLVRVPNEGVAGGETFISEEIPKIPKIGRFSDGPFDCASTESNLCLSLWCPAYAWGIIIKHEGRMFLGCKTKNPWIRSATPIILMIPFILNMIFYFRNQLNNSLMVSPGSSYNYNYYNDNNIQNVAPLIVAMAVYYIFGLMVFARYIIRKRFKIPGYCCTDCLWVYFCGCCSVLQIFRHLRRSGESVVVDGCEKRHKAIQV